MGKWWRAAQAEQDADPEWAELAPQSWDAHDSTYAATSFMAMARRIPALVREALRVAWAASRSATVAAVSLQVGAGLLTGLGLLATTGVLQALFAGGPTPQRVRAALPSLALVVAARAGRSGLEIAAGWAQARLSPLVDLVAERRLFGLTTRVELLAFDDPAFDEAMRRARDRGMDSVARVVDAMVDVVTGAVGVAAAAGTLAVLHPVLLPLLVLAALPHGWASVRAARVEYLSMIAHMGIRRRKWILSDLMADRRTAAEVRAYTAGGYLLDRYAAVARRETAAQLRVAQQQSLTRAVGAVMAGYAELFALQASGYAGSGGPAESVALSSRRGYVERAAVSTRVHGRLKNSTSPSATRRPAPIP